MNCSISMLRAPGDNGLRLVLLPLMLLLSACGAKLPPELSADPPQAPALEQVRSNPEEHRGRQVRWGGIILATENHDNSSWISIVALELDGNGRPYDSDNSLGRFVAVVDSFVEPLTYSRDRLITVSGTLDGIKTQTVGDFRYDYPVVKVDAQHLWPKRSAPPINPYVYPQPYYWPYRPWYHPLYGPYPYAPLPHKH
jgi:outer membrane lipoprotein